VNFILSHHAEEKIIQRQISLKILQDILNNPEQILVRIYINDLVEPQKIVTLYVTSKLRKYRQLSNES